MLGMWLRYWLIWPGCMRYGQWQDADIYIGQSFGRNSVPDERLHIVPNYVWTHGSGVPALALEKLVEDGFLPGEANEQLAAIIQKYFNQHPRPTYVQWEIAAAFPIDWFRAHQDQITILWPPGIANQYFSGRDVLMQTWALLGGRPELRVALFAHQSMIVRVWATARKIFGVDPIIPEQNVRVFDRESVRPWTRNWWSWNKREILARVYTVLKRWA